MQSPMAREDTNFYQYCTVRVHSGFGLCRNDRSVLQDKLLFCEESCSIKLMLNLQKSTLTISGQYTVLW
jgi:hypothetical protein